MNKTTKLSIILLLSLILSSCANKGKEPNNSNQDWDFIISQYEDFSHKCIKLHKKMRKIDESSEDYLPTFTEVSNLESQAEELETKLKNAKGKLSTEQKQKFEEIELALLKEIVRTK